MGPSIEDTPVFANTLVPNSNEETLIIRTLIYCPLGTGCPEWREGFHCIIDILAHVFITKALKNFDKITNSFTLA